MTHICVGTNTNIGSDNGLSPGRRQAIICTNAGILLIGPLGTNFSEILIEIQTFSLKKKRLKMSSAKCCSFCLGLNVLKQQWWPSLLLYLSARGEDMWSVHCMTTLKSNWKLACWEHYWVNTSDLFTHWDLTMHICAINLCYNQMR